MTRRSETILKNIDDDPHATQHIDHLKKFLLLERRLRSLSQIEGDIESEDESDRVIKEQIKIINECAGAEAGLIQDTLYKLEIWRAWKGEDLPNDPGFADKLVFSVLEDLTNFFGEITTDEALNDRRSDHDASIEN